MQVVWTQPVLDNDDDIYYFIAQDSPVATYNLAVDILERTGRLLADNSLIGRVGRVPGTHELVISGTRYIVAYRIREHVEVIAVMRGA